MVKFIGEYGARIDDKGRMVFPAAFKAQMGGTCGKFVVKKDLYADCLEMFTYEEWERTSDDVREKLNFFNPDDEKFWRGYMSDRAVVEPDEKLSRILVPKKLLESIGVVKDAVFFGSDHKIEIWAKEKYEAQKMSNSDFVALARRILGNKNV
jgi:MraZ protein